MAELLETNGIKIIAFYLPQFHCIPENDKAWGEGFTEWVNVKKAKSLFENHRQPKIPLNQNYYNLLDDNIAAWQSEIAQKNGVFGFCYYHYWFKNGKKLLEKPAERMLQNSTITIPFCFCWANENWTKRWDGGNHEIIVKQDYGGYEEWEEHFQYFLPFFRDPRYITMNGRPILIIYKPNEIERVNEMVLFIKKRCVEEGLKGCVIVFQDPGVLFAQKEKMKEMDDRKCIDLVSEKYLFDYYIMFEPKYTWLCRKKNNLYYKIKKSMIHAVKKVIDIKRIRISKYKYDEIWEMIINREYDDERLLAGAFVDWDNTPRRRNGEVFIDSSPEKFEKYMMKLIDKLEKSPMYPIVFMTAWNEWGEGSYLEPDEDYGYQYLEALKRVVLSQESVNRSSCYDIGTDRKNS